MEYRPGGVVCAVFFSPTGTTRTVVSLLARTLAAELSAPLESYDFTLPAPRERIPPSGPLDVTVVGLPVYAGRLPNVLLPYLEQWEGRGALAVPVVLFGNRNFDDALIELRDLLEQRGYHTLAGAAFVGEHAFSRTLAAGRPDSADLDQAQRFARAVADKLRAGPFPTPAHVAGRQPVGPYYQPRDQAGAPIDIRKVKPTVDDRCDHCGRCAALCPMGSIDPSDVTHYTGICIKCGACIKGCPRGARGYDDPGYLYHKQELELGYARPAPISLFL